MTAPRLDLAVDRVQAETMGLSTSDLYGSIQLMMGAVYAQRFYYQGRVLRVMLQSRMPKFRMGPEALDSLLLPSTLPTTTPSPTTRRQRAAHDDPALERLHPHWTVALAHLAATTATRRGGSPVRTPRDGDRRAMEEVQRQVATPPRTGIGSIGQASHCRRSSRAPRPRRCSRCPDPGGVPVPAGRCTRAGPCRSRCCLACRWGVIGAIGHGATAWAVE